MTEELDHNTFDLLDAISGRSYPEHEVRVSFDEKKAFDLYQTDNRIKILSVMVHLSDEEKAELERLRDEVRPQLISDLKSSTYTFKLRGVSRDARDEVVELADKEYPKERDARGRVVPDKNRAEYIENQYWLLHIVSITNPQGKTNADLDSETVQLFRDQAPVFAVEAVAAGIRELIEGSKAGFESLAQDTDFLSERSPEA